MKKRTASYFTVDCVCRSLVRFLLRFNPRLKSCLHDWLRSKRAALGPGPFHNCRRLPPLRSSSAPALPPSNIIKSFVHQGLKNEEDLLDYRVMTVRETRRLKFIISFVSVTKAATSCDSFFATSDEILRRWRHSAERSWRLRFLEFNRSVQFGPCSELRRSELRHLCAQLTSGYSPFETLGLCPEQLGIWGWPQGFTWKII